MIPVDLSEMAEFIAVVQNRFVFLTCVSRCQLQFVGSMLEFSTRVKAEVGPTGVCQGFHRSNCIYVCITACIFDI